MPLWTYQRRARLAGPRLPSMLRGAPRDLLTLFILPLICLIALAEPASGDPRQLARARWEATEHDITSSITAGVAEELLRTEHQPQQSELNSTMDDGDFNDFLFRRSLWAPKPGRSRRAPGSPPQPPLPLAQPLSLQAWYGSLPPSIWQPWAGWPMNHWRQQAGDLNALAAGVVTPNNWVSFFIFTLPMVRYALNMVYSQRVLGGGHHVLAVAMDPDALAACLELGLACYNGSQALMATANITTVSPRPPRPPRRAPPHVSGGSSRSGSSTSTSERQLQSDLQWPRQQAGTHGRRRNSSSRGPAAAGAKRRSGSEEAEAETDDNHVKDGEDEQEKGERGQTGDDDDDDDGGDDGGGGGSSSSDESDGGGGGDGKGSREQQRIHPQAGPGAPVEGGRSSVWHDKIGSEMVTMQSEAYAHLVWAIVRLSLELLKLGYNVHFSDSDSVYVRDVHASYGAAFEAYDADMIMMAEQAYQLPSQLVNAGIFAAKSSSRTIALFEAWYTGFTVKKLFRNQYWFNELRNSAYGLCYSRKQCQAVKAGVSSPSSSLSTSVFPPPASGVAASSSAESTITASRTLHQRSASSASSRSSLDTADAGTRPSSSSRAAVLVHPTQFGKDKCVPRYSHFWFNGTRTLCHPRFLFVHFICIHGYRKDSFMQEYGLWLVDDYGRPLWGPPATANASMAPALAAVPSSGAAANATGAAVGVSEALDPDPQAAAAARGRSASSSSSEDLAPQPGQHAQQHYSSLGDPNWVRQLPPATHALPCQEKVAWRSDILWQQHFNHVTKAEALADRALRKAANAVAAAVTATRTK